MDRVLVFTAPVGSTVYNTNDRNSDVDKKSYFFPTYDDLYHNQDFSKGYKGDNDIEHHDIRKLPTMLYKSNINFVETLFSPNAESNHWLYDQLIEVREEIASMNLPYLFEACMGMIKRKRGELMRDIGKQTGSDEELARKIRKHAATMYRVADFLQRYQATNFKDFMGSVRYESEEEARQIILLLRNTIRPVEELLTIINIHEEKALRLKEAYRSMPVNESMNRYVNHLTMQAVKKQLLEELSKS
jgi:predicted nucleotidyltransferase